MATDVVTDGAERREVASAEAAEARRKYDRAARFYDWETWPMELMAMRRFRGLALSQVSGPRVLEVGVGTGINLPAYPLDLHVDAVDLSPKMLQRARQRPGVRADVRFHEMDIEDLQFDDATFDTIVSTCVFCSVPDPVRGLRELRRVLRPEGRAVFLEHVRPGGRWLGALFDRLDGLVSRAGPHINRRTSDNIRTAGFTIGSEENLLSDIVKLMVASR